MHGLIVEITARPGKRDELVEVLRASSANLPGNLHYVVAVDTAGDDVVWITQIWESQERHAPAIHSSRVQAAMAQGSTLIASVRTRARTRPVVGV